MDNFGLERWENLGYLGLCWKGRGNFRIFHFFALVHSPPNQPNNSEIIPPNPPNIRFPRFKQWDGYTDYGFKLRTRGTHLWSYHARMPRIIFKVCQPTPMRCIWDIYTTQAWTKEYYLRKCRKWWPKSMGCFEMNINSNSAHIWPKKAHIVQWNSCKCIGMDSHTTCYTGVPTPILMYNLSIINVSYKKA